MWPQNLSSRPPRTRRNVHNCWRWTLNRWSTLIENTIARHATADLHCFSKKKECKETGVFVQLNVCKTSSMNNLEFFVKPAYIYSKFIWAKRFCEVLCSPLSLGGGACIFLSFPEKWKSVLFKLWQLYIIMLSMACHLFGLFKKGMQPSAVSL